MKHAKIDIGPVYYTTRSTSIDIDKMDITYVYNAARWFVRKWKRPDLLPIIDSVHSGHARTILKWCVLKQEDFNEYNRPVFDWAQVSNAEMELLDKHHDAWDIRSVEDRDHWDEPETNPQFTKLEDLYCNSRFLLKVYYPKATIHRKRHCLY
jgi:hypothetical protein